MPSLELGSRIFELRKRLKLTQVQLAEKVGVSGAAISHFEKGISNPAFETIEKLSEALNFDLSNLYLSNREPESASEFYTASMLLANQRFFEDNYTPNSYDTSHRGKDQVEDLVDLIIYRQRDFVKFISDPLADDRYAGGEYRVTVLSMPGIDYGAAFVLEIQGSSMAPRYPDGSRYVIFPVEDDHWQYSTGVHAIWLKSKKLLIKRIVSNKEGILHLRSDATGDQTTVELSDIGALWRLGQATHLPPEEL